MADDNVLEIKAVIDLSSFLPSAEEMASDTQAATEKMSASFAEVGSTSAAELQKSTEAAKAVPLSLSDVVSHLDQLISKEAEATTALEANTAAQRENNAAKESSSALNDEELFGPAGGPTSEERLAARKAARTPPESAAPAQANEEAAAIEAANAKIQASESETADLADQFEARFKAATGRAEADAEQFAVTVSEAVQKVAKDLAELEAVARIQSAAVTEAFRLQGDAAALGSEKAVSAIGEQIAQLAVTRAEISALKEKLKELVEAEVEAASTTRVAADANQALTDSALASADAYAKLIDQQQAAAAAPAAAAVDPSVSAEAWDAYATSAQAAADADASVSDAAATAQEAVANQAAATDASAEAYLRLAGAEETETATASEKLGIIDRLVGMIQSTVSSLTGQSAATEAASAADARLASAYARLIGIEEAETAATRASTAATRERTVAENSLNQSFSTGLSNRIAASESLQVMEGTMRGGTRAAGALLAEVLQFGPVFQFAFPVIGAFALVEIFGRMADKLLTVVDSANLTANAVRKITEESANLQIKADDTTRSLEAENLQLQDMIAKVEGHPEPNKLAIALIEVSNKADQLAVEFQKDFEKIGEQIDEKTTLLGKFKAALSDAFTTGGKAMAEDFFTTGTPFGENLLEQGRKASQMRQQEYEALQRVKSATEAVGEARAKAENIENEMAMAKTDAERVALSNQLRVAYGEQATQVGKLSIALNDASAAARNVGYSTSTKSDIELAARLSAGANQAKSEIADLGLEITRVGLTIDSVEKEQRKQIAETRAQLKTSQIEGKEKVTLIDIEGEKQAAAEELSVAQQMYKKNVELAVQAGKDRTQAELDGLLKLEAAERTYSDAVAAAEKKAHEARVTAIEAQITLAKTSGAKQGDELKLQLQNLNNQLNEENAKYENEKAKLAADAQKRITEDELREIQARMNAQKEALKAEVTAINEKVAAAKAAAQSRIEEVKTGTPTTEGSEQQIERINQLYQEGMITFRQYQSEKAEALRQEKEALDEVYTAERSAIELQMRKIEIDISEGRFQGEALAQAQKEYEKLKLKIQEVDNAQQKMEGEQEKALAKLSGEVSKYSLSWQEYFTKFVNQFGTMREQFTAGMQQMFTQFTNSFANAIAQTLVYGRNFGDSMRQVFAQMLADFISMLARMIEEAIVKYTILKALQAIFGVQTGDAASEAARRRAAKVINADSSQAQADVFLQAIETVPFPFNLAAAPAAAATVGAMMGAISAEMGKAEKGALLPHDMLVHAHEGELIVPKAFVPTIMASVAAVSSDASAAIGSNSGIATSVAKPESSSTATSALMSAPKTELSLPIALRSQFEATAALTGTAEKGGLLSKDGPLFAHANELIIPSGLSQGLQNVVAAGGLNPPPALTQNFAEIGGSSSSSSSTTNHYHSTSVSPKVHVTVNGNQDGMKDLHNEIVRVVKRATRNGALNFAEGF
jgi:hypothetical protein